MNTRAFVAPLDVCELLLWQFCAAVLQRDDIGVQDDLFGPDDQSAAGAVLAAIAAQFDAAPAPATFLAEPTLERLACHLRSRERRLNEQAVVQLQPHGAGRPFFFVPSGEGNVLNFHALARRMGADRPFYGLQTRGLHGDRPPFDRVEDMAADHVESLRAIQPHGPYLLGGHCIGAMVALEMALQLQRRGERVALLAAVESVAPAVFYAADDNAPVDDPVEFYVFISRGFKYWFGRDVPLEREELLALEPDRRAAYFMELARRHAIYPPDTADDRITRILGLFQRICRNAYVPAEPLAGPMMFFRARDSAFCETAAGGWEGVATRPLRVRELPGNHVTIVTEPHVELLARELRAALAEADA